MEIWKTEQKIITHCPICGKEGLCHQALAYMKEKGWAGLGTTYSMMTMESQPIDKKMAGQIPDGATVPRLVVSLDVCEDGHIFANRIAKAHLSIRVGEPPPKIDPRQLRNN